MSKLVLGGKEISELLSNDVKSNIASLQEGQVIAVMMKNVSTDDDKVQIEFAEKISLSTAPTNTLAMFNPGDDRFSSGARRVWQTANRKFAEEMFGVKIPDDKAYVEINKILKPVSNSDFRIRIIEKLESELNDSQREYKDNYLKITPSNGNYFYDDITGERVASTTQLVLVPRVDGKPAPIENVQHVLIKGSYRPAANIAKRELGEAQLNENLVS